MDSFTTEPLFHNGQHRLAVRFAYNANLVARVKALEDAKWSKTHGCWHVADTRANRNALSLHANEPAPAMLTAQQQAIEQFRTYLQSRRYSEHTIATYQSALRLFLQYFPHRHPTELTMDDVTHFLQHKAWKMNRSISWQRGVIGALKLYYRKEKNLNIKPEKLEYPRKDKKLPNVLSRQEVKRILSHTRNLKHKAMLSLLYGCGLRSG